MFDFSKFELDHIGIAVTSLAEGFSVYKALGAVTMEEELVPSEKVRVGFLNLKNNCKIELLEATDPASPIQVFLDKRGPGIHHICLRVENLDQLLVELKSQNVRVLSDAPRQGAGGCRVIFVHPKSAGGVLIELSEPKKGLKQSEEEL